MIESIDDNGDDRRLTPFPAPLRFGHLRWWRRDSGRSLGLAVFAGLLLALLVFLGGMQWSGSGEALPSVSVQQVALQPQQEAVLNLSTDSSSHAASAQEANEGTGSDLRQVDPVRRIDNRSQLNDPSQTPRPDVESTSKTARRLEQATQIRVPGPAAAAPGRSSSRTATAATGRPAGGTAKVATDGAGSATLQQWNSHLKDLGKRGLDVVITFDSTGSMALAIDDLKRKIEKVSTKLIELVPSARVSLCTYRDHGDDYVVKGIPLTNRVRDITGFLAPIIADGGYDTPEAVFEGLKWSCDKNAGSFRKGARRMIVLFGDAPPHAKTVKDCLSLAREFKQKGGIISTVTVGFRPLADFRLIAETGGGIATVSGATHQVVRQILILAFGPRYLPHILREFDLES